MLVIWNCPKCGEVDAHCEPEKYKDITCPLCGMLKDYKKEEKHMVNNIFFESPSESRSIRFALVDIGRDLIPATLDDGTVGVVMLSIPDNQLERVRALMVSESVAGGIPINLTGEKKAKLLGTTITIKVNVFGAKKIK